MDGYNSLEQKLFGGLQRLSGAKGSPEIESFRSTGVEFVFGLESKFCVQLPFCGCVIYLKYRLDHLFLFAVYAC